MGIFIYQRANTNEWPQNIVTDAILNLDEEVCARMLSVATLSRNINRRRAVLRVTPPIPQDDEYDFIIPPEYTTTGNDLFLQYDNNRDDRLLIFGTQTSLDFLERTDDWFMDGTFTYCPPQFKQLYTVHGVRDGAHTVGAYALLPNETEATYTELFNEIKYLTNNADPQTIMTDFERAAINASTAVYPNAEHSGCFFHLS